MRGAALALPIAAPAARAPLPASLEARAASLPLGSVLARRPLVRLVPGTPPAMAFLHLAPDRAALAAALGGPLSGDILLHLADGVASRLMSEPSGGMARGDHAPLLIDLPAGAIAAGAVAPEASGWVAALPLESAADPLAFASLAGMARAQRWAVALHGLNAQTLDWLRPGAVAADWFILGWSEALREAAAIQAMDPARLILTGCDTDAALDWGLGQQIRVFGGRAVEAWAAGQAGCS